MPRTRAETLAAEVEARIAVDQMRPGQLVGTIEGLRSASGYARSTVSEAVRLLRDRGVLEIRPGRGGGLFVAAPSPVVRLRHMLLSVRDSAASVEHAMAVREELETLVDLEAARHRTSADIQDLRDHLERLAASATDLSSWTRANWQLHERIAAITPNQLLSTTYIGMLRHVADASVSVTLDWLDADEREQHLRQRQQIHRDLVEGIIAGDEGRTASAARKHRYLT